MQTEKTLELIIEALKSKKARDITSINVSDLTVVADNFVLCSGTSVTHNRTLADYADEVLSKAGNPPKRIEGKTEGRWIAIDFYDVILHIFLDETREAYCLEKLWERGGNITKY